MELRSPTTRSLSSTTSAAEAAPPYSIEEIAAEEGLLSLKEDWDRLSEAAESPNVFMAFDWFRAWNRRYTQDDRSGRRPSVLVLKKMGAVMGISPLVRRRVFRYGLGGQKLEFVGREADYHDLVLGSDPPGQCRAVIEHLAKTQDQWDLVDLRDLRDTRNILAEVENALSQARLTYRLLPEVERCPYLVIDAPWSVMASRLSHSSRRLFRKQQLHLKRMGAEGLRIRIMENPQNEPGLMEKLIDLESQKHVQGEASPPVIGKYPEVFQELFNTLGPRQWFCIALMELRERLIAWQVWFRCGKKLWGYLTAYDRAYAHLSPGTMLVPAMIDYGFAHGYHECDFLRDEEAYKGRWSTSAHQSCWLRIWSRSWISRVHALIYLGLKPRFERLLRRTNRP
jgi:CelD/BcsL family acetyltransferase involved in cellulose biosynthesis